MGPVKVVIVTRDKLAARRIKLDSRFTEVRDGARTMKPGIVHWDGPGDPKEGLTGEPSPPEPFPPPTKPHTKPRKQPPPPARAKRPPSADVDKVAGRSGLLLAHRRTSDTKSETVLLVRVSGFSRIVRVHRARARTAGSVQAVGAVTRLFEARHSRGAVRRSAPACPRLPRAFRRLPRACPRLPRGCPRLLRACPRLPRVPDAAANPRGNARGKWSTVCLSAVSGRQGYAVIYGLDMRPRPATATIRHRPMVQVADIVAKSSGRNRRTAPILSSL
jgi:hypothetical protein